MWELVLHDGSIVTAQYNCLIMSPGKFGSGKRLSHPAQKRYVQTEIRDRI